MDDDQQMRIRDAEEREWELLVNDLEKVVIKWRNKQVLGTLELVGVVKRLLFRLEDRIK